MYHLIRDNRCYRGASKSDSIESQANFGINYCNSPPDRQKEADQMTSQSEINSTELITSPETPFMAAYHPTKLLYDKESYYSP